MLGKALRGIWISVFIRHNGSLPSICLAHHMRRGGEMVRLFIRLFTEWELLLKKRHDMMVLK